MGKSEVEELTEKTINDGGLLAQMYFDMQSESSEELQPLLTDLIDNRLLKTPGVLYCFGAIDEPILLQKEKVYSSSAQLTLLFKNFGSMVNVVFNFAPAGIEILKPTKDLRLKISEMQSLLLDISNISVSYSEYILGKVLSKEDFEKVDRDLKGRAELGKRLLEKKDEKKG
jgi:hypothetical protein